MIDLKFIGGIESTLWIVGEQGSRAYSAGYRVYDELGIAQTITSQGGGPGGYAGLYLVRENE